MRVIRLAQCACRCLLIVLLALAVMSCDGGAPISPTIATQESEPEAPVDEPQPPADHVHDHHHHVHDDYHLAELARQRNEPRFVVSEELAATRVAGPPHQVGQWSSIVRWPFVFASAANLPDGRIIAWGGNQRTRFNGGSYTYTGVWDPATGQIQERNYNQHSMFCAIPTMRENGQVFVIGGDGPTNNRTSVFDYRNDSWQHIDTANSGRWYSGSLQLPNGDVFVALGSPGGRYPELWTEGQGWRWLNGIDLQGPILSYANEYDRPDWFPFMTVAPQGHILHLGPTPRMHYITPESNGSIQYAGTGITNWASQNQAGTMVMFDKGKVLTLGGIKARNKVTMVDMNGGTPQISPVTNLHQPRAHANAVVLPTGEVFVVGGTSEDVWFSDQGSILTPEIWNPQTRAWRQVADHAVPRNYHSVALLMTDGRVFSGGGGLCGCNADHPDHQVYSPSYLFNDNGSLAARPTIHSAPNAVGYGAVMDVEASANIETFSMVKMSGTTHAHNTDQRFLKVPFIAQNGSYQLLLETNPNVLTPGFWMLFAINRQGVPSVAKVVQIQSFIAGVGLISPGDQSHFVNQTVNLPLEVENPDGRSLTFSATGLPDGLSLHTATGAMSGVLTTVGRYEVTVNVSDGVRTDSASFSWAVLEPGAVRFVRLVAESEVNGNPWTSAAEVNVLDASGNAIPRSSWRVTADSQGLTELATHAIDGNTNTIWHTEWRNSNPPHPHELRIDMGAGHHISGLRYLPRQTGAINGTIAQYKIHVSPDGIHWSQPVAEGTFANNRDEKTVLFGNVTPQYNLVQGKTVRQSSTLSNTHNPVAEKAVDGNIDGNFTSSSVTHTQVDTNAWWEIDLGQRYQLDAIRLWNRTDCCANRLSNFHVLISDEPFASQALVATQNQAGVTDLAHAETAGRTTDFTANRTGRFIRVQLGGANYLQLAEVEILGTLEPVVDPLVIAPIITTPQPTGVAITYTANFSGGANPRFKWLFGDGTSETTYSTSPTISHTYHQPGQYRVTLTGNDDRGQEVTLSFNQRIHRPSSALPPAVSMSVMYEQRAGSDRVWNVNPDNHTVSIINATTRQKSAEIAVGEGPRALAQAPDQRIWVANKKSASLTIIDVNTLNVAQTIPLPQASQPHGLVFAPDGHAAYVVLEAKGELLKLDPASGSTLGRVDVGRHARHLSMSADSRTLYVTRFITPPVTDESTANPQVDTGGGEVIVVDRLSLSIERTIRLRHSNIGDVDSGGRGIPNYLGPAVISPDGVSAWVPSKQDNIARGMLRDGRNLNHENTVRSISSYLNLTTQQEESGKRIDHNNGGIATTAIFSRLGHYLFVSLEGSREMAVVDAYAHNERFRIDVGRAPQGLALSSDGQTLYVHNYLDRSLSVIDLSDLLERGEETAQVVATVSLVANERLSNVVLTGKRHFYDTKDPRLARDGYISCASCHHDGGEDGRVWDLTGFGEGLRNTIDLRGRSGMGHGPLHWSANFDEVQDFENQIRSLAGGSGFLSEIDFSNTQAPLGSAKAGLSADLDALAVYVSSLASVDPSPYRRDDGTLTLDGVAGRAVFAAAGCASCHQGPNFTDSGMAPLHDIGSLTSASGNRLGETLSGIDTPTLRGVWQSAPYLHDGSAATLRDAVAAHEGVNLTSAQLDQLVAFLEQIDAREPEVVAEPGCGPLVQEAEAGDLTGDFTVGADPAASGGAYVHVPDGTGYGYAESPNRATYCFRVVTPGLYYLRAWVYADSGASDSFFIRVNGQPAEAYLWDTLNNTQYAMDYVSNRNGANPLELILQAGDHTITFYHREDGARLDKLELELIDDQGAETDYRLDTASNGGGAVTQEPDQTTYRAGTEVTLTAIPDPGWQFAGWAGDLEQSANPTTIRMDRDKQIQALFLRESSGGGACEGLIVEAEHGVFAGNFTRGQDPAASGGAYAHTPDGSGSRSHLDSAHRASYCFRVETPGRYQLQSWVYADSGFSDSFRVRVDGQPVEGHLWDITRNTTYLSDMVSERNGPDPVEFSLQAGDHQVEIFLREDGARLDKLALILVEPFTTEVAAASQNQRASVRERRAGLEAVAMVDQTAGSDPVAAAQPARYVEATASRLHLRTEAIAIGGAKRVAIGDLNQDGWMDVVAAQTPQGPGQRSLMLLMNMQGELHDVTHRYIRDRAGVSGSIMDLVIGDVDGDTWSDVILASAADPGLHIYRNLGFDRQGEWLGLALDAMDFSLTHKPTSGFCAIAAGDVNGDQKLDLYLLDCRQAPVAQDVLLINTGTGGFIDVSDKALGARRQTGQGAAVQILDMDGDGDNDLVKLSTAAGTDPWHGPGLVILFNDGNGRFTNWQVVPRDDAIMLRAGDVNRDGKPDIYLSQTSQDEVLLWRDVSVDGYIRFISQSMPGSQVWPSRGRIQIADLNRDGRFDVGVADQDVLGSGCQDTADRELPMVLLYNVGGGTFKRPVSGTEHAEVSGVIDFAVVDIDRDGREDLLLARCRDYLIYLNKTKASLRRVK